MKQKIKVLYVIGTLEVGGSEMQLVQLVTRLDPRRFEVALCALSSGGPYLEMLTGAGIPVKIIGYEGLRIFRYPHRVIAQLVRLVTFMRHMRPDIVHGFLFWAYVIGTLAARAARVPIVIASRRSLGHFKANQPHYLAVERIANRMTDLVIANSEAVKQDAMRQEKLPAQKVIVIYNGIDTGGFARSPDHDLRRSLGLEGCAPLVGVVANFIRYKGHDVFLDGWASVVKKCPTGMALFLGEGPERSDVESRVKAMGLGARVRFLGVREDVPALLAIMDLVVHPSWQEGFSNAILEAMAAGKPVVATAVGGSPEAVVHGQTGLLVPTGDSQALAEAMVWIVEHPAEAARFGEAARRRVAEHFDVARMVRQYEGVYTSLVDKLVAAGSRSV
jgi:glycosyltransferase involved in cell wall biosynthesis